MIVEWSGGGEAPATRANLLGRASSSRCSEPSGSATSSCAFGQTGWSADPGITHRLELIPATLGICEAEARGPEAVGLALRVRVPASWPPPVLEPDDSSASGDSLRRTRGLTAGPCITSCFEKLPAMAA